MTCVDRKVTLDRIQSPPACMICTNPIEKHRDQRQASPFKIHVWTVMGGTVWRNRFCQSPVGVKVYCSNYQFPQHVFIHFLHDRLEELMLTILMG